jgi:hypothetical protein
MARWAQLLTEVFLASESTYFQTLSASLLIQECKAFLKMLFYAIASPEMGITHPQDNRKAS